MSAGRADALGQALRSLERWLDARGWAGSDPYDALNATRLPAVVRRRRRGRQLLTQAVKRFPLDLRPLLGVPAERNAAALANAVSAYAKNGFLPDSEARAKLDGSLRILKDLRCAGFEEPSWGYHFDVQTRVFFYPRGAPNSIASSFAAHALLDAYDATGDASCLELAEGVGDFFLRHVPQTEAGPGVFFGYLVGDRTPIHNANLLVGSVLARLTSHVGRTDFRSAAEATVRYTVGLQRPDGSWPYGERAGLDWVDGYHTGYVLEALMVCRDAGIEAVDEQALARGLDFYRRRLFLADGTPKFTDRSVYPVDSQCAAQGIQTFALAARGKPELLDEARRVFAFAHARLRRPDGAFAHQRRRFWVNRTPHVRWGAAPMLLALVQLRAAEELGA